MQSRLKIFLLLRRLATGWILFYVLICFLLGGTDWAESAWAALAILWPLILLPICLWSWKKERAQTSTNSQRLGNFLEILATNMALALLLGEWSLRASAAFQGQSPVLNHSLQAYLLQPGQDYGHGLRGNQLGYPGPDWQKAKSPGKFRIAALGDSFAVGPAVPFGDNYLTVLQKELGKVEVLNFGVSATGPREYHLILEKDGWQFHPDLVLVSLFIGNDISERLATPRHLAPEQHSLFLLCRHLLRMTLEHQRQGHLPAQGDRLSAYALSPQTFREVEARRLEVCLQPLSESIERRWQRALSALEDIFSSCQRRGVPVAIVLIADEFQVNPEVLQEALVQAKYRNDKIDLHYPQKRIRDFCRMHHVPCLDLLPYFQGHANTYALRDTHWNARGNHLAAMTLAQWLKKNFDLH